MTPANYSLPGPGNSGTLSSFSHGHLHHGHSSITVHRDLLGEEDLSTPKSNSKKDHQQAPPQSLPPISTRGSASIPIVHHDHPPLQLTPLQDKDKNTSTPNNPNRLPRKPSSGLFSRLKLFDIRSKRHSSAPEHRTTDSLNIGRIPEQHLQHLESIHRDHQIIVERKGRPWSGLTPPKLELLPDETTATQPGTDISTFRSSVMAVVAHHDESDMSSIISTSEGPVFSESDDSDGMVDVKKYRLPDFGKVIG
jgi:hypothetical protein